ncbi:glycine oxidase ThiO [Cohnella nanjingensis]|uniref:glycine oxidase n=1 Tax=Cohnella nanjingensis TaxID=1387779 RepID=A0A7X0RNQ2_9BACL|nr:glycine oxidase ThiO [Cohnella nanjingensis]MBB6669721.1 glycine oxidase ThiO [Cohnella nanjingensis]
MKASVLIVGGGIIGLSCAWEAAKRGFDVTLIERDAIGGQASGAAAGMLAPFYENGEGPDDFFRLCVDSLLLYPDWVREIEAAAGIDTGFVRSGSLHLALHEADRQPLLGRLAWQRAFGARGEWAEGAALRALEPAASPQARGALFSPAEGHVNAPKLVAALETACRGAGVRLVDHAGGLSALEAGSGSFGVRAVTDSDAYAADLAVCCVGAWSGGLAEWLGIRVPIHPIRGQICAFGPTAPRPRHLVFSSQAYWVAKGDGSLVCGASEDDAGFDRSVTESGVGRLVRWGERVLPMLRGLAPVRSWAGLRPATLDGWPLLGPVPRSPNVFLAAGHYRNGILLSPVTAAIVGRWLGRGGGPGERGLAAFAPDRFDRSSAWAEGIPG